MDSNGQTHWKKPTTKFYENAMRKKEKKEKKENRRGYSTSGSAHSSGS